jgi:hypothetical protein
VVVLVEPHDAIDPLLQVTDPSGLTRGVDGRGNGEAEATTLTARGSHMIRVADFAGATGTADVTAIPVTGAPAMTPGETASATTPAVFEVDVGDDDDPVMFAARSESPTSLLEVQVVGPDGYATGSPTPNGPPEPGAPVSAIVGRTRTGRHLVVVSSSDGADEVSASLSAVPTLTAGESVTTVGAGTYLVEMGADQLSTVTARSARSFIAIDVVSPDGLPTGQDVDAQSAAPGQSATAMVGGFGPGTYQVQVSTSDETDEVTATLESVAAQTVGPGQTATAGATAAVFDVDVTDGRPVELTADSASASGVLAIRVDDPQGQPADGPTPSLPLVDEVPPEYIELFPPEVVALFADGLPATMDEASSMLEDAGLVGEFLAVLDEHPDVVTALVAAPSSEGAPATTLVGGQGSGTYRVIVTSSDPTSDVTVSVAAIAVQPLAPGAPVPVTVPATFDVAVGERPLVFTAVPGSGDAVLAIEVIDQFGQRVPGSSSPSASPGARATAIVGGYGFGTYQVVVTSSPGAQAVVAQLE